LGGSPVTLEPGPGRPRQGPEPIPGTRDLSRSGLLESTLHLVLEAVCVQLDGHADQDPEDRRKRQEDRGESGPGNELVPGTRGSHRGGAVPGIEIPRGSGLPQGQGDPHEDREGVVLPVGDHEPVHPESHQAGQDPDPNRSRDRSPRSPRPCTRQVTQPEGGEDPQAQEARFDCELLGVPMGVVRPGDPGVVRRHPHPGPEAVPEQGGRSHVLDHLLPGLHPERGRDVLGLSGRGDPAETRGMQEDHGAEQPARDQVPPSPGPFPQGQDEEGQASPSPGGSREADEEHEDLQEDGQPQQGAGKPVPDQEVPGREGPEQDLGDSRQDDGVPEEPGRPGRVRVEAGVEPLGHPLEPAEGLGESREGVEESERHQPDRQGPRPPGKAEEPVGQCVGQKRCGGDQQGREGRRLGGLGCEDEVPDQEPDEGERRQVASRRARRVPGTPSSQRGEEEAQHHRQPAVGELQVDQGRSPAAVCGPVTR